MGSKEYTCTLWPDRRRAMAVQRPEIPAPTIMMSKAIMPELLE